MELGAILVVIAIILAAVSFFIDDVHVYRLLAAAIILSGVGVLVGVGSGLVGR